MPRKTLFKIKLGEKIKRLRKEKNITQEDLGFKLGVKATTIANYESGYSQPDNEVIVKIATILEVSVDYLLGNTILENPKVTLEEKLTVLNLSEKEYDNLITYWTSENSIPMIDTCLSTITKTDKANNIINKIYTTYVKSNLSSLNDSINSKTTLSIKQKQSELDMAFLSLLKTLDKNKILLNDIRLASYGGLNLEGLDEIEIKDVQNYINYKREQKNKE